MGDIVDTAVAAGSFKTLVAAVQAAGMVETLKGKGPFTVFAPDDEAFAKLPAGTVDGLLKNVPRLKAVLMYHVVPGKLTVDEIGQMNSIKTIQGQEVRIDAHKWWHLHMNPKINDANITSKDIVTDNGMIHVLNRVLMPNMELTCPVCGMGFMNIEAMNAHTKTAHVVEKAPEPMSPAEVMPVAEKAPEPIPGAEVTAEPMPAVEKTPEPLPVVEVIPAVELPATTKVTEGVFEILLDAADKFRFHLKAANGQIIAISQSYGTKESAIKGIASIKKNAPIAKIADLTTAGRTMPEPTHAAGIVQDPVFEIQSNAPDKFRFHLKAANGQIIAVSQSYLTRQSTEKGIASVKKNAPMAKVIDHTIAGT
jgi:uncharacterized surface protein with fasciclin (FAS1) repeats/uncharacterized protein YegP (UPF0339 family)